MWTPAHQELLERFNAAFSAPHSDDLCREWTLGLAEQFAYTFPAAGWGTKRADPSRPQSTDVICTREPFTGYDVLLHQGTPQQALTTDPAPIDLTGQVFIAVTPTNHLGLTPLPPLAYPYPDENTAGKAFQERVRKAYSDAGRAFPDPNDPEAFRHFMRYGYSCHEMPEPEAADKHIAELRAQLGV
jgi:hypothetical protein